MFGLFGKKKAVEGSSKEKAETPGFLKLKQQLLQPRHLSRKDIIQRRKEEERRKTERRLILKKSLLRAGVESKPEMFSKWIIILALIINVFIGVAFAVKYADLFGIGLLRIILLLLSAWLAIFLIVLFLLWLSLYLVLDMLSYKRKVGIEEVFSDYLLLVSTNIRAGMPIDKALWYAVRPRFGVLANEIEIVAKETMSGEELETALKNFSNKYESPVIKNTINLLIEGINAGGELAELLSKVSQNIQDTKLLKQEMAAGISAYAIFITAAALVMAPLLFALSSQLLMVVSSITSNIQMPESTSTSMPIFALKLGNVGVSQRDFLIFAFTNLFLTSLISAIIVSIIRKGDIKSGIKYIPIFIAVCLVVFYATYKLFSLAFSGIISP
ncbi:MAG: type II secretion system F family protein [Candidatus Woesearchaeota archaeon]